MSSNPHAAVAQLDRSIPEPTSQRVAESRRLSEGRYRVVVTANERSRNPVLDLDLRNIDFTNYRRNPVVLYNHGDGQIHVGRTVGIGQDTAGRIVATFEFLPGHPFAERVGNAWDMGFLRAASIRWLPLEADQGANGRIATTKADMLGWSIVAVPANQNSLRTAARSLGLCRTTSSPLGGARCYLCGDYSRRGREKDRSMQGK